MPRTDRTAKKRTKPPKKVRARSMPERINMFLRILGYIEDNAWVAHCLEMDLRAEGESFDEACSELLDLIRMQVSFAFFKDQVNLLNHPAPHELFTLFEHVSQSKLTAYPDPPEEDVYEVTGIRLPRPSKRHFLEARA